MKKIIILIVLFSSNLCFGGTIAPGSDDSKHIEYGEKHECVLPIMGHYGDPLNRAFKGSCVLIDENYILTAAHVVYGSMTQYVVYENKAYPLQIIAIHINFNLKEMGQDDIAIGRLQKPIKMDFYPEIYKEKDEKNKVCSIAGYGNTGTFDTGWEPEKYDNKKRGGSNIIFDIEKKCLITSVTDGHNTELEFLIAPGDSGGGLFIDNKLAGINSAVISRDGNADSDYGDLGFHTRLSDYSDWINQTRGIIETILKYEANEKNKNKNKENEDFKETVNKAIRQEKEKIQNEK